MEIDLIRGRILPGESYSILEENHVVQIKLVDVTDKDTIRTIVYMVEDCSDPDVIPLGATYRNEYDKTDPSITLNGTYVKQVRVKENLTKIEYEKNVYNTIVSLLLLHGNMKKSVIKEYLVENKFFPGMRDDLLQKRLTRICNGQNYGNALKSTGGWIVLDKDRLSNNLKKPSILSQKKEVSITTLTRHLGAILTELGYKVID